MFEESSHMVDKIDWCLYFLKQNETKVCTCTSGNKRENIRKNSTAVPVTNMRIIHIVLYEKDKWDIMFSADAHSVVFFMYYVIDGFWFLGVPQVENTSITL